MNNDEELTDDQLEEHMQEHNKFVKNLEEKGLKDTQMYFNRINDKLFGINNMALAGYFALCAIYNLPKGFILIPVTNLIFLFLVEHRMLKKCRFEANYSKELITDIDKYGRWIKNANQFSYITIFTTAVVLILLIYYYFNAEIRL